MGPDIIRLYSAYYAILKSPIPNKSGLGKKGEETTILFACFSFQRGDGISNPRRRVPSIQRIPADKQNLYKVDVPLPSDWILDYNIFVNKRCPTPYRVIQYLLDVL